MLETIEVNLVCQGEDSFEITTNLLNHSETADHVTNTEKKIIKKCNICGHDLFGTEKACSKHINNHSSKPQQRKRNPVAVKHVCEICGKKYDSNAALGYHQRVHTGERPYQCLYCPKTFTMPLFLQIHFRTHTGERPYECNTCSKSFTNKAALQRHDRVHTGEKPYPCPRCGKTFQQSNSVKLHVKTVHDKLPAPYKNKKKRNNKLIPAKTEQLVIGSNLYSIVKLNNNEQSLNSETNLVYLANVKNELVLEQIQQDDTNYVEIEDVTFDVNTENDIDVN